MSEPSSAERRAWRDALCAPALILLTAYPLQFGLDFLRERNLLRKSMLAAAVIVAVATVVHFIRQRAGVREWAVLGAVGAAYLFAASRIEIVQERVHLFEYGAVALLFERALTVSRSERCKNSSGSWRALDAGAAALGLGALVGIADELVQGALPNRQFDLRDIGLNSLAVATALIASVVLALARARDRGGRE